METESYIYQRLMVAGSQGRITFSKSGLHDIYKFSKGAPRLINLLCDRALLGGFTEQTHYIDKDIVKMAKDSLLGEEKSSKPFYSFTLPKSFTSLRIPFLTIFVFLLAGMILLSRGHFSSLQNAKTFIRGRIQYIFYQMPGPIPPSVAAFPLDKSEAKYSLKNELTGNSEGSSQEVSE
jgi:hypothetical protein